MSSSRQVDFNFLVRKPGRLFGKLGWNFGNRVDIGKVGRLFGNQGTLFGKPGRLSGNRVDFLENR